MKNTYIGAVQWVMALHVFAQMGILKQTIDIHRIPWKRVSDHWQRTGPGQCKPMGAYTENG